MKCNVFSRAALTVLGVGLLLGSAAPALAQTPKTTFTVVRDTQWGAYNLNPFVPGDQHLLPTLSAIYESLFFVNSVNGKISNVLGTKYAWSNGNKTLTVTTRDGVKWTDGQAFTAKDVAFTFNYLKQYPATDTSALWKNGLASVKATSDNTVVFTFSTVNTPTIQFIANQAIVPEHIWASIKTPLTETNQKAVGTGPFTFDSYSQQALRVLKNPNYWMKGQPYVDAVVWIATASNDAALLQLLKNNADFGYIGISDPKGAYASKGPNFTYWWPTNNTNFLYFNTVKAPFNDVNFRRAIAGAINTKDVATKAYAGIIGAASSDAIIPAQQQQWAPANSATLATKFDPKAASALLTKAGYKMSGGKLMGKDGKAIPSLKILVGAGWTDFITMAQVISQNLKQIGIQTTIDQQAWSSYSSGLQTGNYDMGISWGWSSGSTPFYVLNGAFDPSNTAPMGKTANSAFSRYTNPAITKALATFRTSSDAAVQKKAIGTIVTTLAGDVPWVPLTDRANFSLYNTSKFTNFPTAANPYNDGGPDDSIGGRLMYLNVKPK